MVRHIATASYARWVNNMVHSTEVPGGDPGNEDEGMRRTDISRRRFLQVCGYSAVLASGAIAAPGAVPDRRPNIVFILTDDQRYDAMGCAGNTLIRTPHIDSLAARGTRFDRAFVTLSICSPSRAACLTGRYGSANGVTTLGRPLKKGVRTFAHVLKDAGYQAGFAGKWHLGTTPARCGFDFVSSFMSNGPYYNRSVRVRGKAKKIPGFIDDFVADQSIEFMKTAAGKKAPFVLWMCTQVPHMNHTFDWNARADTLALYDPAKMPVPATWRDDLSGKPPYLAQGRNRTRAQDVYGYGKKAAIQRHMQRYYAAVTEVDAAIGRVIASVETLGIADNTWFLFMGDNGWFMGEHGMTSKVLPYEESIRVPMIVAGPATKARVDRHLVLNIDLAATVLDLAGVRIPKGMHGKSLVPLLSGAPEAWRESFLYEAPTPALGSWPLMAVRTAKWKYIQTYDIKTPSRVVFEELYDMTKDPREMSNLAADKTHADIRRKLSDRLRAHRQSLKTTP